MIGEGASRDYSLPINSFGKKAKGNCKMRGNIDNVVIIDIDSDGFDNVIIIDVPDSLQQKLRSSSVIREGKKFPIQGIIHIEDDERHYVDHSRFSMENNGTSPSNDIPIRTSAASNYMQQSEDAVADDCGIVKKKIPAFKLSKCRNMQSKRSPPRNRYGLNSDSETDFSKSDSDCEVIEGSSTELREQWEKVCLKRKLNIYYKGQSGLEDEASPCSAHADALADNVGNGTEQGLEAPICSRGKNVHYYEVNSSDFAASGDLFVGGGFNPWMDRAFAKSDDKIREQSFSWRSKPKSREDSGCHQECNVRMRVEKCMEGHNFCCNESRSVNRCDSGFQIERNDPCRSPPCSIHKAYDKESLGTSSSFQHREPSLKREHSFTSPFMKPNLDFDKKGSSGWDRHKDASSYKDQFLGEDHNVDPTRVSSLEKDLKSTEATSNMSLCSDATHCESIGAKMKDKVVCRTTYLDEKNAFYNSIPNIRICEGMNSLDAPFGDVISTVQRDIINERERLKETDEYKRVVEEEWAARQKQLQIQAEEAKRLKRRQKAESLRILDMKKRQKKRIEEVREPQRKDEENLNVKENIRAEVRKELRKLESICIDMASLLRGLGIHVEGGSYPLSQEVHAAYKRGLLKFHPDRASRTDVHQQVEAEEKFKLISRMKEKVVSL